MVVMILEICQASSLACPAFLRNLVGSGQYIAPWNLRRKYKVLDYPSEASKVIIDKSPEIRYHHPSKVIDHQGWRVVFICPSLGWPLDPNSRESKRRAATGGAKRNHPLQSWEKYGLYMFIPYICLYSPFRVKWVWFTTWLVSYAGAVSCFTMILTSISTSPCQSQSSLDQPLARYNTIPFGTNKQLSLTNKYQALLHAIWQTHM